MRWFISEILPILRKKGFRFTLDIIGSWNSYDLKAAEAFEEIRMTGFIPDLAAHISGSIALIPIRIGSGMRMKALDAVAAQVPIITTTKGIEGIDLRNEEEFLIADSPEAIADAIICLSQNTDLQKKLSANASERLKALYQPERMLEKRMNV